MCAFTKEPQKPMLIEETGNSYADRKSEGKRLNPEEIEAILRAYRSLVSGIAQHYFIRGADREDVIQEGMIGLWKAIRDFKPGSGRSFDAFARLCIKRQIITAVKAAMRGKQRMLTECVSLDTPILEECTLLDALPDESAPDILEEILRRDSVVAVLSSQGAKFSPFELNVMKLYTEGYSYAEIAKVLGCGTKSVDCAIFRVKRKLRALAAADLECRANGLAKTEHHTASGTTQ
jgi:RNA polymerase sporulation-specific sigma factor